MPAGPPPATTQVAILVLCSATWFALAQKGTRAVNDAPAPYHKSWRFAGQGRTGLRFEPQLVQERGQRRRPLGLARLGALRQGQSQGAELLGCPRFARELLDHLPVIGRQAEGLGVE